MASQDAVFEAEMMLHGSNLATSAGTLDASQTPQPWAGLDDEFEEALAAATAEPCPCPDASHAPSTKPDSSQHHASDAQLTDANSWGGWRQASAPGMPLPACQPPLATRERLVAKAGQILRSGMRAVQYAASEPLSAEQAPQTSGQCSQHVAVTDELPQPMVGDAGSVQPVDAIQTAMQPTKAATSTPEGALAAIAAAATAARFGDHHGIACVRVTRTPHPTCDEAGGDVCQALLLRVRRTARVLVMTW
jgi:hypothetical protein